MCSFFLQVLSYIRRTTAQSSRYFRTEYPLILYGQQCSKQHYPTASEAHWPAKGSWVFYPVYLLIFSSAIFTTPRGKCYWWVFLHCKKGKAKVVSSYCLNWNLSCCLLWEKASPSYRSSSDLNHFRCIFIFVIMYAGYFSEGERVTTWRLSSDYLIFLVVPGNLSYSSPSNKKPREESSARRENSPLSRKIQMLNDSRSVNPSQVDQLYVADESTSSSMSTSLSIPWICSAWISVVLSGGWKQSELDVLDLLYLNEFVSDLKGGASKCEIIFVKLAMDCNVHSNVIHTWNLPIIPQQSRWISRNGRTTKTSLNDATCRIIFLK